MTDDRPPGLMSSSCRLIFFLCILRADEGKRERKEVGGGEMAPENVKRVVREQNEGAGGERERSESLGRGRGK